jgi:hypothetical protein
VAVHATTLGSRFVAWAVSVLYRGCAVPAAWKVRPATEPHAWKPEWPALLRQFQQVVPARWKVLVLADRGLYAKDVFPAIGALGWHPLRRITSHGKYRPQGWRRWRSLRQVAVHVGQRWQGRCTALRNQPSHLDCTLLACWEDGHEEPGLVVTDRPVAAADVCW